MFPSSLDPVNHINTEIYVYILFSFSHPMYLLWVLVANTDTLMVVSSTCITTIIAGPPQTALHWPSDNKPCVSARAHRRPCDWTELWFCWRLCLEASCTALEMKDVDKIHLLKFILTCEFIFIYFTFISPENSQWDCISLLRENPVQDWQQHKAITDIPNKNRENLTLKKMLKQMYQT